MKRFLFLLVGLLGLGLLAQLQAQQTVFDKVKVHYSHSGEDVRLVDKNVDLIMDDSAKKLIVRGTDHPIEVSYDDVTKVVLDVTKVWLQTGFYMRYPTTMIFPSVWVNDYWCYIEYKQPDGTVQPYLIEVAKAEPVPVVEKMRATFGDRVILAKFPEAEEVDKNTLAALQTKHDIKVDKKNRPMPELKPDKALVVVVLPAHGRLRFNTPQFKLHANDKVIAVNRIGTYSFAYLDPGKYKLVSQSENAVGMELELKAGEAYYFLQDVFAGRWKAKTGLSQHTKELVMYELGGAWYSDWKEKKD